MKELMPKRSLNFSRQLRTNQTPWEHKLWQQLRANRFHGLKFKRQQLIENYIVDFYCHAKKLIIELDGGHHNDNKNKIFDRRREKFLKDKGYTVLRFWNNEVDDNLEGVLYKIKEIINI